MEEGNLAKRKIIKYFNSGIGYLKGGEFRELLYRVLYLSIIMMNKLLDCIEYRLKNKKEILVNGMYLMRLNPKDKGLSRELYIYKKREIFSTEFIKKIIRDDDVIIDIGANIGYYALLEAKLASKGIVYAIEPVPENIELLKTNIKLNNCKNIFIFQLALGDKIGKAKMYIYDKLNWSSFIKSVDETIIREINISLTTLDKFAEDYIHEPITFIRMDVEGYEYQIIKGSLRILKSSNHLRLCIELHPHLMPKEHMEELISILRNSGFKVRAIFLDPYPEYHNRWVKLVNTLRRRLGLQEFGFAGSDYETLNKLLKMGFAPICFFERS